MRRTKRTYQERRADHGLVSFDSSLLDTLKFHGDSEGALLPSPARFPRMVCLQLADFEREYDAAMIAMDNASRCLDHSIEVYEPSPLAASLKKEPTWLSVNEVANVGEYSFT